MDKYEYKVRADEIKELIARGEYVQAAEIADTIDWRRVRSVMMLCTISDLYKINRRYEDARNMLLLAYERRPGGRTICYSLCELSIKLEDFVAAVNYYTEFVQVAPKDSGRYILQYKLYEAQEVSLEERISVLEELKKRDYREKWAYELAYLYHRMGLATRCVEECDELILWFGEGKYVIKAMELKMLHQPLTPRQQEKYDHRFDAPEPEKYEVQNQEYAPEQSYPQEYGQEAFYTGQDGMEQGYPQEYAGEASYAEQNYPAQGAEYTGQEELSQDTRVYPFAAVPKQPVPQQPEELDIQVKPMDMGVCNTINLQAEIAAGMQEMQIQEMLAKGGRTPEHEKITHSIVAPMMDSETESLDLPEIDEVDEEDLEPEEEIMESSEVFFGETGEIGDVVPKEEAKEEAAFQPQQQPVLSSQQQSAEAQEQAMTAQPPKELENVLAQESDGQISLVMPEAEQLEKQITGQMNIEDIIREWEQKKQENVQKRQEEVRQHVLQQTGQMFTDFEAAVRDGVLEQLEEGKTPDVSAAVTPQNAPQQAAAPQRKKVQEPAEAVEPEKAAENWTEEPEAVEAAEDWTEEPEAVEAAEDWTEEPETVEAAENWQEEPEAVEAAEDWQEEPEAVETAEDWQEEPETVGAAEDWTEEPEAVEAAENWQEEPEAVEAAEDWQEEPEAAESTEETEEQPETVERTAETKEQPETVESTEETEKQPETVESTEETKEQPETTEAAETSENQQDAEPVQREKGKIRRLTKEEKELFSPFIQSRSSREQLIKAIDAISMAAYTGNIIVTGDEGMDTISLAKNMIREVQMTDSNFAGKVAKISGNALNKKDVAATLQQLNNGALIIQKASLLNEKTVQQIYKTIQQENMGIILVLEDTTKAMGKFLEQYPDFAACFTARMNIEALSNDTLVAFGKKYAREKEYSIDEFGVLALHTKIDGMQTLEHAVTIMEVKEMIDEAIRHANRKTVGHFFDILFARRYDDEDMIILGEKDFE